MLSKEYELIYRDKEKEQDLLNNTVSASLREIRTSGQKYSSAGASAPRSLRSIGA